MDDGKRETELCFIFGVKYMNEAEGGVFEGQEDTSGEEQGKIIRE